MNLAVKNPSALGLSIELAAACHRLAEAAQGSTDLSTDAVGAGQPKFNTLAAGLISDPVLQRLNDVLKLHALLEGALQSQGMSIVPTASIPGQAPDMPAIAINACLYGCSRRSAALEDAATKLGQLGCTMRAVLDDVYLQTPTLENGHIPSIDEVLQYGHKLRYSTFAHAGIFPGEPAPQPLHMAYTRMMTVQPPIQLPPPPLTGVAQAPGTPQPGSEPQQPQDDPMMAYIQLADYFQDLQGQQLRPVPVPREYLPPAFISSGDYIPPEMLSELRETLEQMEKAAAEPQELQQQALVPVEPQALSVRSERATMVQNLVEFFTTDDDDDEEEDSLDDESD